MKTNRSIALAVLATMTFFAGKPLMASPVLMNKTTVAASNALLNNLDALKEAETYGSVLCGGSIELISATKFPRVTTTKYVFNICQTMPNGMKRQMAQLVIMDKVTMGVDRISHEFSSAVEPGSIL